MSLVEYRIDGVYDKEQHAIETLQAFAPEEGYYVAFSGGKDSVCIKKLCDLAGVKYDAHYRVTSIDPPELVQFIKREYPDVEFDKPRDKNGKQITMMSLISHRGIPPTRFARYCCEDLKETGGYGRMTVTGVRWAESNNRKENQGLVTVVNKGSLDESIPEGFERAPKGGLILNNDNDEARDFLESCYRRKATLINPIIDWEDEDVWEFIHKHNIPYCELYDKGWKRLGCIGCPMGRNQAEELERYPKYKNMYLMAFAKLIEYRKSKGYESYSWKTPEDVMNWWLSPERKEPDKQLEGQMEMEL